MIFEAVKSIYQRVFVDSIYIIVFKLGNLKIEGLYMKEFSLPLKMDCGSRLGISLL